MAASHTRASSPRWGGVSLVASGLAMAAFWLLVIPFPTFAGAEVALDSQQLAGQAFHVLAALLAVFGYVALRDHHLPVGGRLLTLGYVLSVAGAVGFFTDGVIGLVVNPALAGPAPATVEATGAMFTGVVLVFYVVSFAVYMIGLVVFGLGMLRAGSMPRAACLLLVAGAVPMNLPTLPVTHVPQVIGGLLVGAASVWLGARLIALADRATVPARTSA